MATFIVDDKGDYLVAETGEYIIYDEGGVLGGVFTAEVMNRASAKFTFTVEVNVLSAPRNVKCSNVGDGSVELAWQAPASGVVDHYDILMSTASGGTFVKVNVQPIVRLLGRVYNIPFGYTVYSKVRAVDVTGEEGPLSELADDAAVSKAAIQMMFVGPVGDYIPKGSIFSAIVNGSIVALKTEASGFLS